MEPGELVCPRGQHAARNDRDVSGARIGGPCGLSLSVSWFDGWWRTPPAIGEPRIPGRLAAAPAYAGRRARPCVAAARPRLLRSPRRVPRRAPAGARRRARAAPRVPRFAGTHPAGCSFSRASASTARCGAGSTRTSSPCTATPRDLVARALGFGIKEVTIAGHRRAQPDRGAAGRRHRPAWLAAVLRRRRRARAAAERAAGEGRHRPQALSQRTRDHARRARAVRALAERMARSSSCRSTAR